MYITGGDLTINLVNTNIFTSTNNENIDTFGIYGNVGLVAFTGGGTLNATASGGGGAVGIFADRIELTDGFTGFINASADRAAAGSGIYAGTVTVSGGTITASGGGRAIEGTVVPPSAYMYWVGGSADGANTILYNVPHDADFVNSAAYRFIRIKTNYEHVLTVVVGTGGGSFPAGTLVQITANPASASGAFLAWDGGDGGAFTNAGAATTTFRMPDNPATVTVVSQPAFYLTVEGGTIDSIGGPNSGYFPEDAEIAIRAFASPPGPYAYGDWQNISGGGTFLNANSMFTTFTMPSGDATVRFVYPYIGAPAAHGLTVINGTAASDGPHQAGTSVRITADPPGFVFGGWISDAGGNFADALSEVTTFTMPAAFVTVRAVFLPLFLLSVREGIIVSTGESSGFFPAGAVVTIQEVVVLPDWSIFGGWRNVEGGGSFSNANSSITDFTMPADNAVIEAVHYHHGGCTDTRHTLAVENGIIDETGETTGSYLAGDIVTITAVAPRPGLVFTGWTAAGGSNAAFGDASDITTTLSMPDDDVTVTAVFGAVYTLTVVNGTDVAGIGAYPEGARVTITANPAPDGMMFDKWTWSNPMADLLRFENVNSITTVFIMPGGDATVTASYKRTEAEPSGPDIPGGNEPSAPDGEDYGDGYDASETGIIGDRVPVTDPAEPPPTPLLNTFEHIAYIRGIGGNLFAPYNNMTRAQAAQMFYNLLLDTNVPTVNYFSDVPSGAWFADAVNALASLNIINGFPDGTFRPEANITRAEFVAIAMRFAERPLDIFFTDTFSDVSETHWAREYINAAAAYGWIRGYGDGRFEPERHISRAEAVTLTNMLLNRVPDRERIDAAPHLINFADVPRTHWAYYDIIEAANAHEYAELDGEEVWQ